MQAHMLPNKFSNSRAIKRTRLQAFFPSLVSLIQNTKHVLSLRAMNGDPRPSTFLRLQLWFKRPDPYAALHFRSSQTKAAPGFSRKDEFRRYCCPSFPDFGEKPLGPATVSNKLLNRKVCPGEMSPCLWPPTLPRRLGSELSSRQSDHIPGRRQCPCTRGVTRMTEQQADSVQNSEPGSCFS